MRDGSAACLSLSAKKKEGDAEQFGNVAAVYRATLLLYNASFSRLAKPVVTYNGLEAAAKVPGVCTRRGSPTGQLPEQNILSVMGCIVGVRISTRYHPPSWDATLIPIWALPSHYIITVVAERCLVAQQQ